MPTLKENILNLAKIRKCFTTCMALYEYTIPFLSRNIHLQLFHRLPVSPLRRFHRRVIPVYLLVLLGVVSSMQCKSVDRYQPGELASSDA